MSRTRSRPAFALVEILFTVFLVGVVGLLSVRLMSATARIYRDAPAAVGAMRTQQQWLRQLRDDAWAAQTVAPGTAGRLVLDAPGKAIRWDATGDTLTRTQGDDDVRRWKLDRPIAWRREGRSLALVAGDAVVPLATPSLARRTSVTSPNAGPATEATR